MSQIDEYKAAAIETAKAVWGDETEQARPHIEATIEATWRISETPLTPQREPVTKLRHSEPK